MRERCALVDHLIILSLADAEILIAVEKILPLAILTIQNS